MNLAEKELLRNQRSQLFRLQKFLREKKIGIDDFCDLLPGVISLNRIDSMKLVYLDKITQRKMGIEIKWKRRGYRF